MGTLALRSPPPIFRLLVCQPYGTRIMDIASSCGGRYEAQRDPSCSTCVVGKAAAATRKVHSRLVAKAKETRKPAPPPIPVNLPATWPDGAPLEYRETIPRCSPPDTKPAPKSRRAARKSGTRSAY